MNIGTTVPSGSRRETFPIGSANQIVPPSTVMNRPGIPKSVTDAGGRSFFLTALTLQLIASSYVTDSVQ